MVSIKSIVDLSHVLNNDTQVYPGDPQPNIEVATTLNNEGYNLFNVFLGSQSGSHVDAPYHFSNEGKTIDQIDLKCCMGRAVVIDMSDKSFDEEILESDIEPYMNEIESSQIVLFRTDWYKKAGSEEFLHHPFLSKNGGKLLLQKGIQTIGIDAINIDSSGGDEFPIHDMYAASGGMIAENLANFDLINFENPFFIALPLKLKGCDGSPVRAVAVQFKP